MDKLRRAMLIISKNGGPFGAFRKLAKTDTLKEGRLVGTDHIGNRYYENNYYMVPRNRWVEYSKEANWDYDASQVPPEWYGWLHHKTDALPSVDQAKYNLSICSHSRKWLAGHEENMSATPRAYYPYRTTPQALRVWDGTCVPHLYGDADDADDANPKGDNSGNTKK